MSLISKSIASTAVLALGLLTVGCATSRPVTGPSGQAGFSINWSGGGGGRWHACYEEAARQCPGGYVVIDRVGDTDAIFGEADGDFTLETMVSRELIIECS